MAEMIVVKCDIGLKAAIEEFGGKRWKYTMEARKL